MPDDLRWSCYNNRNKVHSKCNALNHPETIPSPQSVEGLMLKLKLQYFGHLMQRVDSLEKTLMLGKVEGGRRSGWQRMSWHHCFSGHESEQTLGDRKPGCSPCDHTVGDHLVTERRSF